MIKLKIIKGISFDGKIIKPNEEIEVSLQRYEKMLENFKNYNLEPRDFIQEIVINSKENKPKRKRRDS